MNAASRRLAWLVAAVLVAACGINPQPGLPARTDDDKGPEAPAGSGGSGGSGISLGGGDAASAGKPSDPILGAGGQQGATPGQGSGGDGDAGNGGEAPGAGDAGGGGEAGDVSGDPGGSDGLLDGRAGAHGRP